MKNIKLLAWVIVIAGLLYLGYTELYLTEEVIPASKDSLVEDSLLFDTSISDTLKTGILKTDILKNDTLKTDTL